MNRDKDSGYVNGMLATIERREGSGFAVSTAVGTEVNVFCVTDKYYRTFFPMRPAYAINLSKIQGETLDHMALWLDVPFVPAAMYVALSRVRSMEDILFLGCLTFRHIRPARYV